MRHDLAGGVASSAHDVDLAGRDYANEIMFDGAPDGAQWLGLDRRSFVMTACIRQADILGLLKLSVSSFRMSCSAPPIPLTRRWHGD